MLTKRICRSCHARKDHVKSLLTFLKDINYDGRIILATGGMNTEKDELKMFDDLWRMKRIVFHCPCNKDDEENMSSVEIDRDPPSGCPFAIEHKMIDE